MKQLARNALTQLGDILSDCQSDTQMAADYKFWLRMHMMRIFDRFIAINRIGL